jgi:hypothetical protein
MGCNYLEEIKGGKTHARAYQKAHLHDPETKYGGLSG